MDSSVLSSCEAKSQAAERGNRPRFKLKMEEPGGVSNKRHGQQATLRLLLLQLATMSLLGQVNCDLGQPPAGQPADKAAAPGPKVEEARVAAFASKLGHWFACRRQAAASLQANLDRPAEGRPSGAGSGSGGCPAHYDGHLCWPASEAAASARLPCPRLNWLPGERWAPAAAAAAPFKSVIDSVHLAAAAATATTAAAAAAAATTTTTTTNTSATLTPQSIKQNTIDGPISHEEPISADIAAFALRKCEPLSNATDLMLVPEAAAGRWQEEADYSRCANGSADFDPTDKWIKLHLDADRRLFVSLMDELDRIEGAIDPYGDPDLLEQWSSCISNIMQHQANQSAASAHAQSEHSDLWCPIIFDGWRCWPLTKAGETAYVSCPSNQPGFSAERKAHKICTNEGTWYKHPMTNRYWSNYTTCVDTVDLAFRTKILNLYVIGNLISLVALSASLIIFVSFESLNCTRVTIHKNLFLSFITNNLMWIIWYTYVVNDASLLQSNPIECQLWHILLHYFLVSNYFWMFCEGLYLHTLLVVAFVSEDKILKWFYLLGWLTPVPIILAYAYNRSYDQYYTSFCWMEESPYNLILMAPIGISLLLNLVFLINIVRVLVTKLRANNSPDTHQTRKAVRATLILIPLLGLHYILTPFRPEAKSEWEGIYESIAAVCTSFQGLCVAMLFCFCNVEVITVIKKKLKDTCNLSRFRRDRKMRSRSNTYTSASASNNPHTLRSVISSTSNGDLLQRSSLLNQRASVEASNNNSNSSSLLTNVTASPVQGQTNETILSDRFEQTANNNRENQNMLARDNEDSINDCPPVGAGEETFVLIGSNNGDRIHNCTVGA